MRPIAIKSGLRCTCLCAGSSALMLYVAHTYPAFWYFSLIALVPFLWRLLQINRWSAVCLAAMLATAYVLATEGGNLLASPESVLIELLSFNIALVLFALGINRARRTIGFDPLMVALLWFPIQCALIAYADVGKVFFIPDTGIGTAAGFLTLFGFAMGSLVIVLINALILWLLKWVEQKATATGRFTSEKTKTVDVHTNAVAPERGLYYLLGPRAPPVVITCLRMYQPHSTSCGARYITERSCRNRSGFDLHC